NLYYVDADNVGGAATATSYLIDSGRTTVATVTGPQDMCAGQDRLTGYRDALQKANLPEQDDLVGEGGFTLSSGFDAMTQLLETRPDIDAVFAASDLTALGAMRAIELSGRRIHDDVAVVGFDDIPDARQARPALTTIRQPLAELGQTLSRLLLRRVYGEHPPQASVLPVQLIERETA
ncbi:MAG: substrate-binding domain-containing protein, partial [Nocardioidaceae bacterium]